MDTLYANVVDGIVVEVAPRSLLPAEIPASWLPVSIEAPEATSDEIVVSGGYEVKEDSVVEVRLAVSDVRATLERRATSALAANAAFLDLAAPTQAQTLAQVKTVTKECSALIRLALNLLDSTDGT